MAALSDALLATSPELVKGLDWQRLSLTPRDGFVLSRIDGATSARTLCDLCGLPVAELVPLLERLEAAGAIRWSGRVAAGGGAPAVTPPRGGPTAPPAPTPSAARPPAGHSDIPANDPELNEANDLSPEERRVILSVERRLEQLTHWDLLELHGTTTGALVKQAYFAQSRRFHPDRYFGKSLGSYKTRLENIFKSVRAAYVVLADDAEREKYAELHRPPRAPVPLDGIAVAWGGDAAKATVPPEPPPAAVTAEELERHRQAILEARKKSRQVSSFSLEQAQLAFAKAQEQSAAGDAASAAESYRRALTHDPANPEYRRLYEEARSTADAAKVAELVGQGESLATAGQPRAAGDKLAQAFELAPGEFAHAVRAAELYLEARQLASAWNLVQQVIACAPRRRDSRLLAARILEERGDAAGALLQLQTVATIDGMDPHLERMMSRVSGGVRPG